jgi:sugar lactone lactonase YvrE
VDEGQAVLQVDCRNELGEMPVWCDTSQTLYWVDVLNPGRVFHWSTAIRAVDFWDFDGLVTGINLVAEGGLLIHGRDRIFRFNPQSRQSTQIFSLPNPTNSMRFNDGHCDRAGRLWVGTMPNNISDDGAALSIREHSGQICMITGVTNRSFEAKLGCPNAICWSPDGDVLYVADSCDGWLYAYQFDLGAGSISNRRSLCHFEGLGIPDGAAVDEDGFIWNARWGAGAVARISPEGTLDRIVRLPVSQPTACCFGDRDRRTLYITSARFGLSADALRSEPLSGGIFSIRVTVAGLEVPPFVAGGANHSITEGI